MNIVFDQGVPVPLRGHLTEHQVATAFELGWSALRNGELLAQAEAAGFDLLITTDQNLRYQQNLTQRRIGILVLLTTSWPRMQKHLPALRESVGRAKPASYTELPLP